MTQGLKQVYLKKFRKRAHDVIWLGYEAAQSHCTQHAEEDDITGAIVAGIQERTRDPRCPRWLMRIAVKESNPVNDSEEIGRKRKKPDIIVEFIDNIRPEFIFEAKRLCRPSFPSAKYLGHSGMGRFLDGHYAQRYDIAGMLGYIQSDTVFWWAEHLKRKMSHETIEDCCVHPKIEHEWVSRHDREDHGPMSIYHILLDCNRPQEA